MLDPRIEGAVLRSKSALENVVYRF